MTCCHVPSRGVSSKMCSSASYPINLIIHMRSRQPAGQPGGQSSSLLILNPSENQLPTPDPDGALRPFPMAIANHQYCRSAVASCDQ
jgi:hypothetical protein